MENEDTGVNLTINSEHAFSVPDTQVLHAGSVQCSRSFSTLWSYIHTLQTISYISITPRSTHSNITPVDLSPYFLSQFSLILSEGFRTHWLCTLQRGKTPIPNEYLGYDTKPSDGEAPVLELWGVLSTNLWPLRSGLLWPGIVVLRLKYISLEIVCVRLEHV